MDIKKSFALLTGDELLLEMTDDSDTYFEGVIAEFTLKNASGKTISFYRLYLYDADFKNSDYYGSKLSLQEKIDEMSKDLYFTKITGILTGTLKKLVDSGRTEFGKMIRETGKNYFFKTLFEEDIKNDEQSK